jgi:hypothetical protein
LSEEIQKPQKHHSGIAIHLAEIQLAIFCTEVLGVTVTEICSVNINGDNCSNTYSEITTLLYCLKSFNIFCKYYTSMADILTLIAIHKKFLQIIKKKPTRNNI